MTNIKPTNSTLRDLTKQFTQAGKLEAIYLRPARGVASMQMQQATLNLGRGIKGDRTADKANDSKRQITLIQAEHIAVIAALMGKTHIDPAILRRNLVVSGINLLAAKSIFKDQVMQLTIGDVTLEVTGPCEPCSKMELALGNGAYNAIRGHGGVTARIITAGEVVVGMPVTCNATQF